MGSLLCALALAADAAGRAAPRARALRLASHRQWITARGNKTRPLARCPPARRRRRSRRDTSGSATTARPPVSRAWRGGHAIACTARPAAATAGAAPCHGQLCLANKSPIILCSPIPPPLCSHHDPLPGLCQPLAFRCEARSTNQPTNRPTTIFHSPLSAAITTPLLINHYQNRIPATHQCHNQPMLSTPSPTTPSQPS